MNYEYLLRNFLNEKKQLIQYPSKHKNKLYCLFYLASKFEKGRIYTEKEVNYLLLDWAEFGDYALLRRELFNHRFLNRESDGSKYWLEEIQPQPETEENE